MSEIATNDVYCEFIERLKEEKNLSHKALCKGADISYSHSREVVAGRSKAGENTLYKLLSIHYSRKFALNTMRDRLGFDYNAGHTLEHDNAEPAQWKISNYREAHFVCKLVALDELPVATAQVMLGNQYDETLAKFTELDLCKISGNTIAASQDFIEVFDSPSLKEMARMIVGLTNPDIEFNVEQVWTLGFNDEGLNLVIRLITKFVDDLLYIYHNPAYRGKKAFAIAINTTIL